ncbi:MAG: beta-N-acetylhexosaminidase [Actinobacteria bacterium]|nr:beta-N-acetylhexosaminidase [Actinomycetota bacterium]
MTLPIVPAPAHATELTDHVELGGDGLSVVACPRELFVTAQRFVDDVKLETGLALSLATAAPGAPAITVALAGDGLDAVAPAGGVRADGKSGTDGDERHGISITTDGLRVWGTTVEGVHRGLTSLRQLIAAGAHDGVATLPTAEIVDGPRFGWRGLSLDVVRTFHGPETVRRVIDMCSLHKLNVLHLHLSDDQGWRIEVPSRPELTAIGGAGAMGDRRGGFYSLAELAGLVEYAAARFVTLVPEIDMPGHTGAIFRAYPELAPMDSAFGEVAPGLAIGTLDPQRAETWTFVEDVLDAVVPQFPQSAYVHVGGDEAFGMADEAHAAFVERAIGLVRARARLAVGWQEVARAAIGPDDIAQYWIDSREPGDMMDNEALQAMIPAEMLPLIAETMAKAEHDLPRALEAGVRLLISPISRLYFDQPHAEASADPAQEEMRARVGLPVYPAMSLRHGVEWDPVDDTPGVDSDDQIAGVEAAIWCETIANRDELEFMLLPRLGGAAEKGWVRRGATDWSDYAGRLAAQAALWDARGWNWFASAAVPWAAKAV